MLSWIHTFDSSSSHAPLRRGAPKKTTDSLGLNDISAGMFPPLCGSEFSTFGGEASLNVLLSRHPRGSWLRVPSSSLVCQQAWNDFSSPNGWVLWYENAYRESRVSAERDGDQGLPFHLRVRD